MIPPLAYRRDVDGLRAVAVLAVLAFHAFPDRLPGGFVGVDVFFVISGLLITALIRDELIAGRFRFGAFYARRVRRLFPALAVVLLACLIAGWFLLDAGDYRELARETLAGGGFVANLLFWSQAGYFDAAASEKPLLHLWSLGVEEQYYLAWPLLLLLAWHWRQQPRALRALAWAGFALSLAALAWTMPRAPDAAFYAPWTRLWELLAGALLALAWPAATTVQPVTRARHGLAAAGLLALLVLMFGMRADAGFPWPWALPVVLASAAILAGGGGAWSNRWLLANPPMVAVGRIGYALYLWHWPLLVLARQTWPEAGAWRDAGALGLSLLLAWASGRWIERPIRSGPPRRWKVLLPMTAMALVMLLAGALLWLRGVPARTDAAARPYADYHYDFQTGARIGECWLPLDRRQLDFPASCVDANADRHLPLLVLWGDSHAARFALGLRALASGRFRMAQFTRSGCPPILDPATPACREGNARVIPRIAALKPEVVVLFSWWNAPSLRDPDALAASIQRTAAELHRLGVKRVIVLGNSAQWLGRKQAMPRAVLRDHAEHGWKQLPARISTGVDWSARDRDRALAARLAADPALSYFSVWHVLCNDTGCLTHLGDDPRILEAWDYGHMTTPTAIAVAHALDADLHLPGSPSAPQRGVR